MQVLDDQGRFFGRVNIIDAAVVMVVCLLIPLAYGAYLLFRTPPARLVAVEPARVPQGTAQINVRGEHLRPYLRVTIGTEEATLLFERPDLGILRLPSLAQGSYDVVLYDEGQELGRLRGGLLIEAPSASAGSRADPVRIAGAALLAIGAFRGLDLDRAQLLSQNLRVLHHEATEWGQVVGFQPPEPNIEYLRAPELPISDGTYQIRAVMRLRCRLEQSECRVQKIAVTPGATLPIEVGGGTADFRVEELHPAYDSSVELLVRAVLPTEVLALMATRERRDRSSFRARDALRPSLVSFKLVGDVTDATPTAMVSMRVPAVRAPDGWLHRGQALRVGDHFVFESPSYAFRGSIVSIRPADARPKQP